MSKTSLLAFVALLASSSPLTADYESVSADVNHDGLVTRTEFDRFVESTDLYAQWDLNDNGYLENNEFGIVRSELVGVPGLAQWDLNDDARLSAYELTTGLYEVFDQNRDGQWDAGEWRDAAEAGLFDA